MNFEVVVQVLFLSVLVFLNYHFNFLSRQNIWFHIYFLLCLDVVAYFLWSSLPLIIVCSMIAGSASKGNINEAGLYRNDNYCKLMILWEVILGFIRHKWYGQHSRVWVASCYQSWTFFIAKNAICICFFYDSLGLHGSVCNLLMF